MKKDPLVLIDDVVESIEIIEDHVRNMNADEFLGSVKAQDAVVRRLEIIGEAVVRLPEEFTEKHSDIPWSDLVGMRNVMIHKYDDVDFRLIWEAIKRDLPKLKRQLEKLR